jgi:hypothetical protein
VLVAYLILLAVLIAGSDIRRVGDGREYLDMAQDLLRLHAPSPYVHFWFYPLLAVPFLALVSLTWLDPFAAFVPLNLVLLAAAFHVASRVLAWPALLLLFMSPIVWWVDKAHTEVFTFSLLTIALVAMRPSPGEPRPLHPGWAVLCLAAAGTQNPPFLLLAPIAVVWLVAARTVGPGDRRFLTLCLAGVVLAALHPIYYSLQRGQLSALTPATHGRISNVDEVLAIVRDSNLGLVPNAPVFALAAMLVIGVVVVRIVGGPRPSIGPDLTFAVVAGGVFLASVSQTTNYDHGGTPGMSRYALWLIPLLIPFLRTASAAPLPGVARWSFLVLVLVSSAWSVTAFHPKWPQYGPRGPSWFASWLWTNAPWLDRPLPEVFVERLRPGTTERRLPVATADCGKILLMGQGADAPIWPVPCVPVPVPAACQTRGTFCYADRRGDSYTFSVVPTPSRANYRFDDDAVWTREESGTMQALLERLRWRELAICDVSVSRIERGEFGLGGPRHYCGADRLLAYFRNAEGASVRVRLRTRMSGAFIDASTGVVVQRVGADLVPGAVRDVPIPAGPASVALVLTETGWP